MILWHLYNYSEAELLKIIDSVSNNLVRGNKELSLLSRPKAGRCT